MVGLQSGLHNLYWDLGFELFDSQRFKDVVYVVPLDISPVLLTDDWYNEKNFLLSMFIMV